MKNSPLGQYAPLVAAVVAVGIIGATLLALLFGNRLGIAQPSIDDLKFLAGIAVGAVFGSAVAVNGYKAPLDAVHKRLDEAGIPPAAEAPSTH